MGHTLTKRFFQWVLAPGTASLLAWLVGENLPRPTNWDLLCNLLAGLTGVLAFVNLIFWLAKALAGQVEKRSKSESTPNTKIDPSVVREKALDDINSKVVSLQQRWKVNETYRQVESGRWKGDPPKVAVCEHSGVEVQLDWSGTTLSILRDGEPLKMKARKGEGHPAQASTTLQSEGVRFEASSLKEMTKGMTRLRLQAMGDHFGCRFQTTISAGHGSIDLWVELLVNLEQRSGTYEEFSEYDDCR